MDRLKEALEAIGLKCGGTLEQRADRLFSVKGKAPEQIDQKLKVGVPGGVFMVTRGRGRAEYLPRQALLLYCCIFSGDAAVDDDSYGSAGLEGRSC